MSVKIVGPVIEIGPPTVTLGVQAIDDPTRGANVGTGAPVFRDKTGAVLNFRTLVEGAGIAITASADELEISAAMMVVTHELFVPAQVSAATGTYRRRRVASAGAFQFNFVVPPDAATVVSIEAIAINTSATPGMQPIDLTSSYGSAGESATTHTESNLGSSFLIPAAGELFALPLGSVLSVASAGDYGGVTIDHMGVGGNIDYLGTRTRYQMT